MEHELKDLLEEWAKLSKLAHLAGNADGSYCLLFDGEYEVRLSQYLRIIRIEADLGELPEDRTACGAMLDELMSLQLAESQDAAEILAVDDETSHLVLFANLQANRSSAQIFASVLSQFVNGQEFWTRQVKALSTPALSPFTPTSIVHA